MPFEDPPIRPRDERPRPRSHHGDVRLTVLDGLPTDHEAYGHVSMVFVHPDRWGQGVGRQLLQGLQERASESGWRGGPGRRTSALDAFTKPRDTKASGHATTLGDGVPILQLERQAR